MTTVATANPREHLDQVARVWEQLWAAPPYDGRDQELIDRERQFKRWRLIRERIREMFGRIEDIRCIELGSGRGDLATLLAQEGATVTLLDSSDRALDQARHRFSRLGLRGDFMRGDLFNVVDLGKSFDVAISSGVIEHFAGEQRTRAIQSHADSLRRGGLVIISVPNARCWPYRVWKKWLELRGTWPYGFEQPFSRRELVRRARVLDLKGIEVRGCGFEQSWNDQLMPLLTGRKPVRGAISESMFDEHFGLALVLTALKP